MRCCPSLAFAGCGKKSETAAPVTGTEQKTTQVAGEAPATVPGPSKKPITEERTYYGFETDLQGWEIPQWSKDKVDYIAKGVSVSQDISSEGKSSMKIATEYPGEAWSASLVEIQQYLDLSSFRVISVDIYLPKEAPAGLKAKLILTVGDNWKFVEMNHNYPLVPGQWTTITANIEPGSYDWKRVVPDEKFAQDVRKIAVRIEGNRQQKYTGPIYIDNIRVGK